MYPPQFHPITICIVMGFPLLGHASEATAQSKKNCPSKSSDDIDIDKLAKALRQQLNSMKAVFGDDPSEVGRQIKQTTRVLDEVRSLSDRALQDGRPIQIDIPRPDPGKSSTAAQHGRQQAIRLPDGVMNWPMPKPKPRSDRKILIRAFDFTSFDFSALEKSLEFPKLKRPSPTK